MYVCHLADTKFVFMAIVDDKRHTLGIEDIVDIVHQRVFQRFADSLVQTSFALSETDTDQGDTAVAHRRVDIGEIDILFKIGRNDLGNALGGNRQCLISLAVGLWNRHIGKIPQSFVVDDKQGVYVLRHLPNAFQRFYDLWTSFKDEGDRNDTDGKDSHIFGNLGNDRAGPRTGSSSHPRRNKSHAGTVVEHIVDFFFAFNRCGFSSFRNIAGTKPVRRIPSYQELIGNFRLLQRLIIGIA